MNNKPVPDRMGTEHFVWVLIHLMPLAFEFLQSSLRYVKNNSSKGFSLNPLITQFKATIEENLVEDFMIL